jgi:hypothetical protein
VRTYRIIGIKPLWIIFPKSNPAHNIRNKPIRTYYYETMTERGTIEAEGDTEAVTLLCRQCGDTLRLVYRAIQPSGYLTIWEKTCNGILLYGWVLCRNDSAYTAPEIRSTCFLMGYAVGHPTRKRGIYITTSTIVDIRGRHITTYSGNDYYLMHPDEEYVKLCQENNWHIPTLHEPIKWKTR